MKRFNEQDGLTNKVNKQYRILKLIVSITHKILKSIHLMNANSDIF